MSSIKELATALLTKIERLPYERLHHSVSFKESQYERLRHLIGASQKYTVTNKKPTIKEIIFKKPQKQPLKPEAFNATQLKQMLLSLDNLQTNKFNNYYSVGDKLTKPKGNPEYYDRLMSDIKGENRETWFTAFRTVVFGR